MGEALLGEAILDIAAGLVAGATADLVCFSGLTRRNSILAKRGFPKVAAFPSKARFLFGDGRLVEVRHAADIPVWVAALVLDGGAPALLCKGAMEALGGQLASFRGSLLLRRPRVRIPPRASSAGQFILSAVDFRRGPSRSASRCPEVSASLSYLVHKCPHLFDGGLHLHYTQGGRYRFETPRTFAACEAVTLGGARDSNLTDPKKIAMKLHVNRGRASAQQLRRVLADSGGDNMHLPTCADGVLARREVCQAFEKAPHAPVAGTSTAAMSNEKLQVDVIALRIMDVYSEYSLPIPVRTKNP